MTRLSGMARYVVTGESGAWRYVGQATYVDDEGATVEHDHVRMRQVGGDREVWVDPVDVTLRAHVRPRIAAVA